MEDCYRNLTASQVRVIENYPMPTEEEKEKVNGFFKPYIFFRNARTGRYLTTSCCGRKNVFYDCMQRIETDQAYQLQYGKHNERAVCPFCGRSGTLKEIRFLGKKKNLLEYVPVVFLKERDEELFALATWTRKDYQGDLEDAPLYYIPEVYHFAPGRAEMYVSWYGDWKCMPLTGNYDPVYRVITEPFTESAGFYNQRYVVYHVIGIDAISRSAFRFCQYDEFCERWNEGDMHGELMKFLAACCIWPRNIEMLMKFGMRSLVDDLVIGRRKNAAAIKWGEDDPRKAFGLNGQELRAFMETSKDPDVLVVYKRIRSAGFKADFTLAENIVHCLREDALPFVRLCRKYHVDTARVLRYLDKFVPKCHLGGPYTLHDIWVYWRDYLDTAEKLEYDMTNETVLLPKDLRKKHDDTTEELTRRLDLARREHDAQLMMQIQERIGKWMLKYDFTLDDYFIHVATCEEEIVREGKELCHCVGGYAGRHMEGKTTILFLRKRIEPDKPLVTIEMHGNTLQQAHGYRNEAGGAKPPRQVYKHIFDTWLDWLERGSPRDENGEPKLRKKKEATAA